VPTHGNADSPGQDPPSAAASPSPAGEAYSQSSAPAPAPAPVPFVSSAPDAPKAGSNYTVWSSSPGEGQHFDPKE
jgi:hypothetical protein